VYFNCEPAICQTTGELCPHQFVMRGYADKNHARYYGVVTVIERENGLWEPTGWMTNNHAPKDYHIQGIKYLMSIGYRVSGTFEKHRLNAYRRMFKSHFDLVEIEDRTKTYNGKELKFTYVEFKEHTWQT